MRGIKPRELRARWGQTLETKQPAIVWVVRQNLNGLLQTIKVGKMKLAILRQLISQHPVDVFACSKLGIC